MWVLFGRARTQSERDRSGAGAGGVGAEEYGRRCRAPTGQVARRVAVRSAGMCGEVSGPDPAPTQPGFSGWL